MSRLRRIFVDGDAQMLHMAMEDVLFLSRISSSERASVLSRYTREPQVKRETEEEDAASEVPDLFMLRVDSGDERPSVLNTLTVSVED